MKRLLFLLSFFLVFQITQAQVTTNGGSGLNPTYLSLADAITALNATTISSPVVITLTGNETAPAGGYAITASGDATNTITIQGSSSNITASAAHTIGAINDAIFKIIGSDFITIQNFTLQENASNTVNTPAGSNTMTEFGVALFYATTTNGCQNITIHNNTISLNRVYTNTFGIYANSTHSATNMTTSATATSTAGGNHNLVVTANNISNVNQGIVVVGPTAAADQNTGMVIGGSLANANTISNYGTAAQLSSYANVSGTMNGILVRNTNGFSVTHNSVTSSAGGVTTGTLRGVFHVSHSNAPTHTFTNNVTHNTISVQGGASGTNIAGIILESTCASATSSLNFNNNNIANLNHTVSATTAITALSNASTHQHVSISNNTFTNLTPNTSGSFTFISNSISAPANGSKTINNNSIVTGFNKTVAGGTVALYTDGASSTTGTTVQNNNNNFSNITVTGGTTISGWSNNDGTGATPQKTMTGNTFENWTCGTSAVTVFQANFGNLVTMTGNTINNITGQGAVTGLSVGSSGTYAVAATVANNTITNLSSTGTGGAVTGLSFAATLPVSGTHSVNNNTINTLSSNSTTATVTGITSSSSGVNISNHTIHTLTGVASTSGATNGIMTTAGNNVNVFKNKIYNIQSTGAFTTTPGVNGIVCSGSSGSATVNVFNNLIGDLKADAANSTDAIRGISITATGTTSNYNIYYNTVYIGATSSGTNFGTTGIFHTTSTTGTTASLTLRNNIIVNNSTANGTGFVVAYRRSSTALNNFNSASNNNLFYAGATTASPYFIFYDGAAGQQIAGYKTLVAPRETLSFTENPVFQSTTGSSANFLKIDLTTPTQIESGAQPIAGITDDYWGTTRHATAPDVGAFEGDMTLLDLAPPVISYTALGNTSSTGNRNLVVTVTDASGVPTTAPGWPNLYWRIGTGSWTAATPTGVAGSNYTYSFGAGVVLGDVVQYYVVAQDNASTPNVGAFPSAGAGGFTINPPAAATPPTTPSSYTIVGALSGTYSVGAGQDYATLTAAITDLNGKEVTGPVTFELWDATYPAETFPIIIQKPARANPTDLVTIKPKTGVSSAISGSSATGILVLMGADYIVIDGSNSGGTDRSLTWENTSTAASSYVIGLFHNGTVGASNSTIKNNIAKAGSKTAATTWAIVLNSLGGGYNNITIQNNEVLNAYIGLQFYGISGNAATNGLITQNVFGSDNDAVTLGNTAINVGQTDGLIISNNTIKNLQSGTNPLGILLSTNTLNTNVLSNSISKIYYIGTGGYGAKGIVVNTASPTSNILLANNVISDLRGDGWSSLLSDAIVGIRVGAHAGSATTTGGVNIYYNSVNLGSGTFAGNASGTASAALYLGSLTTNINVRNNIFANNLVNSNAAGAKAYAINSAAATIATINYNDYYASGTQGVLGFLGSDRVDLAAWQTATTQDANSLAVDPQFVSETNLQPFTGSPVLAAGTPIVGVTTDFTGASRSGTTPSMGAYESGQSVAAVDWANLQWPPNATITEGQTFTAYARVWQDGVTPGPGPGAGIESWFGWSATNTDPATWSNWISGTYNMDHGNDDEWMADIGAGITPGTYYYASRFRTTGGTYQYGGYSGGFWNGTTNVSGVLTVNPITISVPHSEGFEAVTFPPTGWKVENVLGSNAWNRSTTSPRTGVANANISWQSGNGEDWLITPQITGVATGDILSFYWRNAFSTAYPPDQLEILVSTTNSNMASFTNVLGTINTATAPNTWTNHTFPLDAFNGQSIYIAFKHTNTDGNGGFLDDVVLTKATTTWLGTSNTAWGTGANWSNGVPLATQNAIIDVSANNPVLGSPGSVNDLTINSGAILSVTNGGQLTVNGVLTNSAGNGGLVLQSNASGTGSLIHNTANVPATIQRYITGGQYHFASVPLTAAANPTADVFLHSYLWRYDPTLPDWVKYTAETDPLTVTQGYMLWYTGGNTTYTFAGNMNNGAFTAATPGGAGTFNLVPNPYPSAINWDAASGWTKTNLQNAIYIYNNNQYASYVGGVGTNGGTNIIPGGQAFFVQATGAATLAMNNNVRTHSGQAFFNEPVINDLFRIAVSVDGKSDETVVRFTESATASFDSEYDAAKLYGNADAPQLYTMTADNQMLSINSLAMTEGGVSVPLSFEFTADGEITLQFSGVGSFSELQAIFLEDLATGSLTNLRQHGSYSFNHLVSNDPDRFLLHFRDITGVDEQGNGWMIFANDRKVYVNIPELNGQRASIEMFDVLGSRIFSSEGVMNSPAVVRAANSGVAIVRVTAQGRVYTTKLFIQ